MFLSTDPQRKWEGSKGGFLLQVSPNPRAGCSEFSRLMWETPGHEAGTVSCWDRSQWKGLWLGDTTEGPGLLPCKALLEDPLRGHGYSLSAEAVWLCLKSEWQHGSGPELCYSTWGAQGASPLDELPVYTANTSWKTSGKKAVNSGVCQGRFISSVLLQFPMLEKGKVGTKLSVLEIAAWCITELLRGKRRVVRGQGDGMPLARVEWYKRSW